MSWQQSRAALRERDLARYLAAIGVSSLGTGMATVALAFAVLELGGVADLGLVVLAREIPMVVLLLLGGVWADRISRRRILVACDVVRAAAQVATGALLLTGHGSVWSIAVAQAVFGMAGAFARPATQGMVQQVAPVDVRQQANALLFLLRSVGSIAGPAIGAVLVELSSPGWAIVGDAASFGASAALLLTVRLRDTRVAATASVVRDLRDGWAEFVSRPWVVAMVCSFGLFQLTYFPAFLVLGPAVAEAHLGGASAWGAILAAGSAGSVAGGLLALRLRTRRPLVVSSVLTTLAAPVLAGLAIPAAPVVIAALGFLGMFALGAGGPIWDTTLQRHIPPHAISRISSFDWLGSVALNPIGYALIGPLAHAIGIGTTLAIAAGLNAASSIGVLAVGAVRALPQAPPDEHAVERMAAAEA